MCRDQTAVKQTTMRLEKLPSYVDLLYPTLLAVSQLGGSGSLQEINDAVIAAEGLTEEQTAMVYETSGAEIIADRCSWARSSLKIAGLLESVSRGVWALTPKGRDVVDNLTPPQVAKAVAVARRKRKKQRLSERTDRNTEQTAADQQVDEIVGISNSNADGELGWKEELLAILKTITPDAFERLCLRILRQSGFVDTNVTNRGSDGGMSYCQIWCPSGPHAAA